MIRTVGSTVSYEFLRPLSKQNRRSLNDGTAREWRYYSVVSPVTFLTAARKSAMQSRFSCARRGRCSYAVISCLMQARSAQGKVSIRDCPLTFALRWYAPDPSSMISHVEDSVLPSGKKGREVPSSWGWFFSNFVPQRVDLQYGSYTMANGWKTIHLVFLHRRTLFLHHAISACSQEIALSMWLAVDFASSAASRKCACCNQAAARSISAW